MEDYLTYAKQLLADFKDVLDDAAAGGKAGEPPAAGAPAPASGKPPLAPGGLFGAGGGSTGGAGGAAAPPASIFGGLPPAGGSSGGGFAFGSGQAAGAPAFGGFGAAGSTPGSAANSGGSGLFHVPSTGTLASSLNTGAAAGADDDEGEEEQQDAEPSVSAVQARAGPWGRLLRGARPTQPAALRQCGAEPCTDLCSRAGRALRRARSCAELRCRELHACGASFASSCLPAHGHIDLCCLPTLRSAAPTPLCQVQVEAGEGTEMLAKQRVKLMSMTPEKVGERAVGGLRMPRHAPG